MDDQQKATDNNIVEAEVIEEVEVATTAQSDEATVLLSLEQMIKHHTSSIEKNKVELKKHRQQLSDAYENDPTFREHDKLAKEAAKVKQETKHQITKQPAVMIIADKAKSMAQEVKELEAALSDYLKEYQRMTGANEIEGEDGELREIVSTVKLIKRSAPKK